MARVQPGLVLGDLQRALQPHGLFFAPDPTSDQECTVGGAIACNASGPRTLQYGATRAHVNALSVVLASGENVTVRRQHLEKNTVGNAVIHEPVDWFVGSEGTLGVIFRSSLIAATALTPDNYKGWSVREIQMNASRSDTRYVQSRLLFRGRALQGPYRSDRKV